MNSKNLNLILLLLTYFATQHNAINAMKRPHTQISNTQQHEQPISALKKTKLNNKTAALLCTICNKTFSTSSNLSTHKKIHTGEKSYKCDMCNKTFNSNSNLIIHQRTHTGEKPYTCNICDKAFYQQNNLTVHTRTHAGEKPYKCDICDKRFAHQNNLINHTRTHTGEKLYKCSTCDKNFANQSNLTRHKGIHAKTITPMINNVTNNISLKSLNTPADYQDILDNIMTFNNTEFNEWIGK